jgi:hypothetical protein
MTMLIYFSRVIRHPWLAQLVLIDHGFDSKTPPPIAEGYGREGEILYYPARWQTASSWLQFSSSFVLPILL